MIKLVMAVLLQILGAAGFPAHAQQDWPNKPIRIISPGSPGSTSDVLGRIILDPVSRGLGTTFLFEYKPGAGTTVAAEYVAKSSPDGYTFMVNSAAGFGIAPTLYKNLKYDTAKDFAGVARLVTTPNVLAVTNDLPARNIRELIAYAKANPGKINNGVGGGFGTSFHLSAVMFAQMAGIEIVHVPYKGNSNSVQALIAGEIQMSVDNLATMVPSIKSGRLRALAVTSAIRSRELPDVPTMIEAGIPGYEVNSWFGVVGPVGIPRSILDRFHGELAKSLSTPQIVEQMRKLGSEPAVMNPSEFDAFYRSEIARWAPVVMASGATAQ